MFNHSLWKYVQVADAYGSALKLPLIGTFANRKTFLIDPKGQVGQWFSTLSSMIQCDWINLHVIHVVLVRTLELDSIWLQKWLTLTVIVTFERSLSPLMVSFHIACIQANNVRR